MRQGLPTPILDQAATEGAACRRLNCGASFGRSRRAGCSSACWRGSTGGTRANRQSRALPRAEGSARRSFACRPHAPSRRQYPPAEVGEGRWKPPRCANDKRTPHAQDLEVRAGRDLRDRGVHRTRSRWPYRHVGWSPLGPERLEARRRGPAAAATPGRRSPVHRSRRARRRRSRRPTASCKRCSRRSSRPPRSSRFCACSASMSSICSRTRGGSAKTTSQRR